MTGKGVRQYGQRGHFWGDGLFPEARGTLACPTRQHGNCGRELTVLLLISGQADRFCPSMDVNQGGIIRVSTAGFDTKYSSHALLFFASAIRT